MQIPYCYFFNYNSKKEPLFILEKSVGEVLAKAKLSRYDVQTLSVIKSGGAPLVYQIEIDCHPNVVKPEQYASNDLHILQNCFDILQNDYRNYSVDLAYKVNSARMQAEYELYNYGRTQINVEKYILQEIAFEKRYQYFIRCNLIFLDLHRSMHNRHGRTCVLYFRIQI